MNDICLWYLQNCRHICVDLARVICSYVTEAVQKALDVDNWSILDLIDETDSYKVKRKGHYFIAAMENSSFDNLVSYVGAVIGFRGIYQRCPDHLDPGYLAGDKEKGKWLYRLISGEIDGIERPIVRATALVVFSEDTASIPQLGALSDIIEASFVIALRTLRTLRPDPRYELHLYAAMVPRSFRPKVAAIGANAIAPVQRYIRPRAAVIRDEEGCRTDKSPLERQSTDRTLGASKRYGCGRIFESEDTIKFRGLGFPKTKYELEQGVVDDDTSDKKVTTAVISFDTVMEISIPLQLCSYLRIPRENIVNLKYDIADEGRHPFCHLQESPRDDELEEAKQLGIRISGNNDLGEEWEFWLRSVGLHTDWRTARKTSNHLGVAWCMSIIGAMLGQRQRVVPFNRVPLSHGDVRQAGEYVQIDLKKAGGWLSRTSDDSPRFAGLVISGVNYGSELPLSRCICDMTIYNCPAKTHDEALVTAAPKMIRKSSGLDQWLGRGDLSDQMKSKKGVKRNASGAELK